MNEMTLTSRHSSPDGLRLSTLPLGHGGFPQYQIICEQGDKHLFLWNLNARALARTRDLRLSMQAALTTAPGPAEQYVPPTPSWGTEPRTQCSALILRQLANNYNNILLGNGWIVWEMGEQTDPGIRGVNQSYPGFTCVCRWQARDVGPLVGQCRANHSTLIQHWVYASYLIGIGGT